MVNLSFVTKHLAQSVLETMAGELDARFDALTGRYTYQRGDATREMWLEPSDGPPWQIIIEEVTHAA